MPTYFFDTYDGRNVLHDAFGSDLADVREAADEAAALLPEFARDLNMDNRSYRVGASVRDEGGDVVYRAALLFRARFSDETPDADNLIEQDADSLGDESRHLRRISRSLCRNLKDDVEELLGVLEQSRSTRESSRREREARGRLHP